MNLFTKTTPSGKTKNTTTTKRKAKHTNNQSTIPSLPPKIHVSLIFIIPNNMRLGSITIRDASIPFVSRLLQLNRAVLCIRVRGISAARCVEVDKGDNEGVNNEGQAVGVER